jgi:hypothetical protein
MTYTTQHIVDKLKVRDAPTQVWQEPYEHDGTAYERLCILNGHAPSGDDLYDYCMDLLYSPSKIQLDLFRYLLPICLSAWKDVLLGHAAREYAAFDEHFFPALVKRESLYKYLDVEELEVVQTFVVEAILERIREEKSLQHTGSRDKVYSWFRAVTDFAIVFSDLDKLWMRWWQLSFDGYAIAALEYLSCLMYEDDCNPIFGPWTTENGGGPPPLNESGCNFHQVGWRPENIDLLLSTLTPTYLERGMRMAVNRLEQFLEHRAVCTKMSTDWSAQLYLVEWRLKQLPELLANSDLHDWPLG